MFLFFVALIPPPQATYASLFGLPVWSSATELRIPVIKAGVHPFADFADVTFQCRILASAGIHAVGSSKILSVDLPFLSGTWGNAPNSFHLTTPTRGFVVESRSNVTVKLSPEIHCVLETVSALLPVKIAITIPGFDGLFKVANSAFATEFADVMAVEDIDAIVSSIELTWDETAVLNTTLEIKISIEANDTKTFITSGDRHSFSLDITNNGLEAALHVGNIPQYLGNFPAAKAPMDFFMINSHFDPIVNVSIGCSGCAFELTNCSTNFGLYLAENGTFVRGQVKALHRYYEFDLGCVSVFGTDAYGAGFGIRINPAGVFSANVSPGWGCS